MAKKVFSYQGRTVEQLQALSLDELAQMFNAAARRKIKRGFTHSEKSLLKKLETKNNVKTHCRDMIVLPSMVGKTIMIHKGNAYESITIIGEMVGHRLGEFVFTRKRITHGTAGVGASRSSANQNRK